MSYFYILRFKNFGSGNSLSPVFNQKQTIHLLNCIGSKQAFLAFNIKFLEYFSFWVRV